VRDEHEQAHIITQHDILRAMTAWFATEKCDGVKQ
jgi:hypothetical protein